MCHVDVSQYIATTTKIWVNKEYYEISSSKLNNLCAFETKAIPMDNLSAISSICFFHVFWGGVFTVSIAHFINDTSILRATWMSVCHLMNIVNKYWWKFIPIKPNWYITHSADYKDINIYVYSVSLTIKIFVEQAIPYKRDKESRQKSQYFEDFECKHMRNRVKCCWNRTRFHWWALTGGKQRWNISCYEISLEQKCV